MTTQTAAPTAASRPARTAGPQWVRLTRILLSSQAVVGVWFWITCAVVTAVLMAVIGQYVRPTMSAWSIVLQVAIWFPFGVSIMLATTYLRTLVAAGATRRAFLRAGVATALLTGIGYALVGVGGLALERVAYDNLGWVQGTTDGGAGPVLADGVLQHLWGMWLLTSVGAVAGLLVGATYLRWGAWATVLLPLTIGAPFAAVALLTVAPHTITVSGGLRSTAFVEGLTGSPLGAVLGLVVLALVVLATWQGLRRIAIRPAAG